MCVVCGAHDSSECVRVEQTKLFNYDTMVYVWLTLNDMSAFAAVNARYCRFFNENPPAR
jgi:hypothetical protein